MTHFNGKPPISCALLGAGIFCKRAHLPNISKFPSLYQLKAVYSRSEASAQSISDDAKSYSQTSNGLDVYHDGTDGNGLNELLARKDISLVILSLPFDLQPAIVELAWKAGKDVFSEKPISTTVRDAKRLIELYEGTYKKLGRTWFILEQYPYEPSINQAKEVLKSGRIGELRSFNLEFSNFIESGSKYHATSWRTVPKYQGGFLLDAAPHFISGFRHLLPSPMTFTSLSAIASSLQPHLPPVDTLHGLLTTSTKIQGSFSISFGIESNYTKRYTFHGCSGSLVLDFSAPTHIITVLDGLGSDAIKGVMELEGNGVEWEFKAFGEGILKGMESEEWKEVDRVCGPRSTLMDLAIVEAALISHGNRLMIDEVIRDA